MADVILCPYCARLLDAKQEQYNPHYVGTCSKCLRRLAVGRYKKRIPDAENIRDSERSKPE